MSGVFGSPKKPKMPAPIAESEPITTVTEDAEVARRRERKRLSTGGRQSTMLAGIMTALKKRLGE
jgi:hypothetical protein